MKAKHIAASYIALWFAVAAVIAYLGAKAGQSPWLIGGGVLALFFFINGAIAYLLRSRQLRREGKQPPTYIEYLFQTGKREAVQPLQLPALIRIALGLLVIFGAVLFIFGGGVFILNFDRFAVLIVGLSFLILGVAFAYIGYRVILAKGERRLLGPLGLRVASYVAALLSAIAIFGAVVSTEYLMGLFAAVFGASFAFVLYGASQGTPPNNPLQPTPEAGAAEPRR